MAIKEKEKAAPAVSASTAVTAPPAPPGYTPERTLRIQPDVDARLTKFMAANPNLTEYNNWLVKEQPDRAVRSLCLGPMFKQEAQQRLIERHMPQVQQWVRENPGMEEQISSKIRSKNPISRGFAFILEAFKAKGRMDMAPPAQSIGTGASI